MSYFTTNVAPSIERWRPLACDTPGLEKSFGIDPEGNGWTREINRNTGTTFYTLTSLKRKGV